MVSLNHLTEDTHHKIFSSGFSVDFIAGSGYFRVCIELRHLARFDLLRDEQQR